MRPGELATCTCCGAQARATWSSLERPWQEGWPVTVTWRHGPHPRHHVVTSEAPTECSWCWERRLALGPDAPPLYRPAASSPAEPWREETGHDHLKELAVPCPACRAAQAEPCRDYRGHRKPPCRERDAALVSAGLSAPPSSTRPSPPTEPAAPARRQLALF